MSCSEARLSPIKANTPRGCCANAGLSFEALCDGAQIGCIFVMVNLYSLCLQG